MKRNHHFSRYLMLLLVITNETRLNTSTRRRDFAYENFLCAEQEIIFVQKYTEKRGGVVVCSRSDHESFSGVPFHGNCVVPWIVSVFCQRWLVLRLIGQLDVRPEVAPPEKGHAPLCKYIGNILQFYVN